LRRSQFTINPFPFVKKMLRGEKSGRLECPVEEIEKHLRRLGVPRRFSNIGLYSFNMQQAPASSKDPNRGIQNNQSKNSNDAKR
jgi:hypothetical protein